MNTKKRTIGVIGGMGPEATVLLMERIIKMTDAKDDIDHVPLIIHNNTQVPSRIKAIIEKSSNEDPAPILVAMAQQLESCGVDALVMPCNTAHNYASVIEKSVNIPFLNIIDLTVEYVKNKSSKIKQVGVLGSPALEITNIFGKSFSQQQIKTIYPQNQQQILKIVRSFKINSQDKQAKNILKNAAYELITNGADILIIACSEFSINADVIPSTYPYIDTIDLLAKETIKFASANLKTKIKNKGD